MVRTTASPGERLTSWPAATSPQDSEPVEPPLIDSPPSGSTGSKPWTYTRRLSVFSIPTETVRSRRWSVCTQGGPATPMLGGVPGDTASEGRPDEDEDEDADPPPSAPSPSTLLPGPPSPEPFDRGPADPQRQHH